jgi:hypothetical protein
MGLLLVAAAAAGPSRLMLPVTCRVAGAIMVLQTNWCCHACCVGTVGLGGMQLCWEVVHIGLPGM